MSQVYLYAGEVIVIGGSVATHPDCCCGEACTVGVEYETATANCTITGFIGFTGATDRVYLDVAIAYTYTGTVTFEWSGTVGDACPVGIAIPAMSAEASGSASNTFSFGVEAACGNTMAETACTSTLRLDGSYVLEISPTVSEPEDDPNCGICSNVTITSTDHTTLDACNLVSGLFYPDTTVDTYEKTYDPSADDCSEFQNSEIQVLPWLLTSDWSESAPSTTATTRSRDITGTPAPDVEAEYPGGTVTGETLLTIEETLSNELLNADMFAIAEAEYGAYASDPTGQASKQVIETEGPITTGYVAGDARESSFTLAKLRITFSVTSGATVFYDLVFTPTVGSPTTTPQSAPSTEGVAIVEVIPESGDPDGTWHIENISCA